MKQYLKGDPDATTEHVSQNIYLVHMEFNRLGSFSPLQYVEEFQTEIELVELLISL